MGGYGTRAAAQAARALRGPGGPTRRGVAGCTTGQWLAAWLAGLQSLRPLTRRSYQHHLDTYLLPCIGNIPLAMLTAADLRVMFSAIARRAGPRRAARCHRRPWRGSAPRSGRR